MTVYNAHLGVRPRMPLISSVSRDASLSREFFLERDMPQLFALCSQFLAYDVAGQVGVIQRWISPPVRVFVRSITSQRQSGRA